MTKITSIITAAMIASASFAGAALADGDYYAGISKTQTSARADNSKVDTVKTGSISRDRSDNQGFQPSTGLNLPGTGRDNR